VGHGKSPKEQPVKENDHGCDAMRYMVAERDLGGRPRIRTLG
jgi:phage terminase large subunit